MSLKVIQEEWNASLSFLYDKREVKNILLLILEDVFGFSRTDLMMKELTLDKLQQVQLAEFLQKLQEGEPVQHLIGFTFFDGLKVHVSKDVLIPRPETEELVFWIQDSVAGSNPYILDCCTGSGCIALALKNRFPLGKIVGLDVSEKALHVAQKNAKELQLSVEWLQLDLLKDWPPMTNLDIIVSNPPYIPWMEKNEMHPNVTKFEPDLALFVPNDDFLLFYRKIGMKALDSLNNGGFLFYEVHENFAHETKDLLQEIGFENISLKQDLQGKYRMLKAQKPSKK